MCKSNLKEYRYSWFALKVPMTIICIIYYNTNKACA